MIHHPNPNPNELGLNISIEQAQLSREQWLTTNRY
jgi:hypothetical protein